MIELWRVQYMGLWTLMKREIRRIFRIWSQTLLPSVITTTLYFLIFGRFIGERIGAIHSVSYIAFIVPGLIMMAVVTNSYSNTASTVFSARFQGYMDELTVSPLYPVTVLLGFISGGAVRGIVIGGLISLISAFFTPLTLYNVTVIVISMGLTAFLFSLLGFLNGLFARRFDEIAIVPTFFLTPLTYLGGVFYSISFLSPFWQQLSRFNPILYLVNLFRYGFLGISDVSVLPTFFGLVIFIISIFILSLFLLKRGLSLHHG